jgi:hypothetical protein
MKNTLPVNRKQKVLLIVLAFLIFTVVNPCFAKYAGGTGEPNTPYQIASSADLLTLANDANDYNKCFILTADINLSSAGTFTTAVIAPNTDNENDWFFQRFFIGPAFAGVFDGSNHKIIKLTIQGNRIGNIYGGLFGQIASSGQIKNLGLENISIIGSGDLRFFGGLVGDNYGDISNCYSAGIINGGSFVGGLVGRHNSGSISNCYSSDGVIGGDHANRLGGLVGENDGGSINNCHSIGSVTGNYFVEYVGGLVGNNSTGSISNSYSTGAVNVGDQCNIIGGLVGANSGSIINCHSTGAVSSIDEFTTDIGGLAGANSGSILNCYSAGAVSCGYGSQCLGGLVGYNWSGDVSNCYSTGNVTAGYTSADLGGLAGVNGGNISNCYSTGAVSGYTQLGGLVGQNDNSIGNCYSTGTVTGSFSRGGLVGYNNGTFSSCYFLVTSGPNNGFGTSLTDTQMKLQASFISWDFVGETNNSSKHVWWLCNEGLEYPRLAWQYLPGDISCPGVVGIEDLEVFCTQWLFNEIPADLAPLGGDGTVNFADFAVFANQWGITNDINNLLDFTEQWLKVGIPHCSADISPLPDSDEIVNFTDFAVMAGNWQICFVTKATSPNPADNAISINKNVILQWSPGQSCASHNIYFGTCFNDVSNSDTSSVQFMGNQISNTWNTNNYASVGLDLNTIYYWRVDETAVDCLTKGDVWSFKVAPLGKATNPQPSDGHLNVTKHPILSWSAATYASSHDVYFGTNYNDVNIAIRSSSEYMDNLDVNCWDTNNYDSNGLGYFITYYWRIDELKDAHITKGDIWSFTTCPEPNINYGLAAWWKFDEANGIIAYDSAGHSDGNLVGGPVWTSGKIGGGLSFDGINDYVNCGSGPSNYDNITVSVWMKTSTYGTLVSNCYNSFSYGTWYALYSGGIEIGGNSSGNGYANVTFKTSTLNGLWHHVVYTKDGTNHTIYVDGSLDQQFISNADISWNVPFFIGRRSTSISYPSWFKGIIDEVRIYNRALSAEEVAQLYSQ